MLPRHFFAFLLLLAASVCACREKIDPVVPDPPGPDGDPVLSVSLPGAYGVESGNEVLQEGMQSSLLHYAGGASWRLLSPQSSKVVSLSGLPEQFRKGDKAELLYRVSERGITRAIQRIPDVHVLQVTDSLVWLKKDEHTFFVIEP